MVKYKNITISGDIGTGKTTLAENLAARFNNLTQQLKATPPLKPV